MAETTPTVESLFREALQRHPQVHELDTKSRPHVSPADTTPCGRTLHGVRGLKLEHLPVRIQQFAERWALFPDVLDPVRNGARGLWIILTYLWVIIGWATMIGRIVWL